MGGSQGPSRGLYQAPEVYLGLSPGVVVGVTSMNGLRVYVNTIPAETRSGAGVFYSRRGDGPFYLWRYEEKFGQWRGSRVLAADFAPRELTMARWKIVPLTLQNKLGEHYVE